MSIFPTSPVIGDRYSGYEWDGTVWQVVGIDFNQEYATTTDLSDHEIDTSNVHGISDTSLLATTSYVDTAESDAITTANAYSDSLATNYDSVGSAAAAQSAAESYADGLASNYDPVGSASAVAGDLTTHEGLTTSVHGISDTGDLVYTSDSRLSDDRTPTVHAFSHESGGSDELTLSQSQITNLTTDLVPFAQYGAEGSVIRNLATRVHPAEQLLKQSVLWLDAAHESAGGQEITNLGWGGAVLNAQSGSTSGADSNDPKFLDWDGENYVYLPGVAGNYLSVPDEAALDITGDIDIRVQVAMDDWTPGAINVLLAKRAVSNFSYSLHVATTTGLLSLSWTTDGSTILLVNSTVAPTVVDGAALWVRVTFDVNNGASGYDVKFFTSADGITWTQLGTTITGAGATSIFSGSSILEVGGRNLGQNPATGKFYRAQIFNGINGTPVLDVDCTQIVSGADTSFTALTGQTVTINRSTSGRKSVAVVSPCWLFGTDDYMEVASSDLINFGASDSFTVVGVTRQWGTQASTGFTVAKSSSTGAGYYIALLGAAASLRGRIQDGTYTVTDNENYLSGQLYAWSLTRNVSADTMNLQLDATTGDSAPDTTTATLANANPFRIGTLSTAAAYANMELLAVSVFRRALTSGEIATLNTYYQGRNN
jgi:hypothetical protein